MIERFLDIKSAISKASIDIKEHQLLANVDSETLKNAIVGGLKPVKIDLEKLCSRNATLLTVEGVFAFNIRELNQRNSEFAKNIKYSLIQRISERRNVSLVGLMQYLNFGRKCDAAAVPVDLSSSLPNKIYLIEQAKIFMTRFSCEEDDSLSICLQYYISNYRSNK
ncbi:hypothetical protein AVEN_132357-1 [Araneus ventricosus]|uniref:Uncharacterized protein n=1 Tax=Araneus ventricosus TaxID=182803 RepID=A0A4Y2MQY0_ARAVE|nr:hypothetical protein AVEN_132357-1 [Araneus ventricosus]